MAFPTADTIRETIAPIAADAQMDVENVDIKKAGKKTRVVIALDGDKRPGLDDLEVVSRKISELFDDTEQRGEVNFGAGYTLEVTTPGVDLPLTKPRHWRRNRGRLVKVEGATYRVGPLNDDETIVALISGQSVVLRELAQLPDAMVEVEFGQPPAAELDLAWQDFSSYDEDTTSK